MDLQSIFYIISIVYMIVFIAIMIIGIVALIAVIKVIKSAPEKVTNIISEVVSSRKNQLFGMAVASIASILFSKIKDKMRK